ncbi:uncharacterized protein [Misgurnus anguillicaudatus]|uniref:uncharacterized protein n=1 Tax=Misgurnus anguillicaudatus TaxID=75329 RepID=UPI003CCF88DB
MERRSCCSFLMLFLLIAVAVSVWGFTRMQNQVTKKLTVDLEDSELQEKNTELGLKNFDIELQNMLMQMDITLTEVKGLENEMKLITSDQEKMAKEAKECQDLVVTLNKQITGIVQEKSDNEGNFNATKSKWTEQMQALKKQLEERSPVCAFVKKLNASGLCS